MRAPDFDMTKVADRLTGQCVEDLDQVIEDEYPGMTEDDLTDSDYDDLDNIAFKCSICGWWCETSERCDEPDENEEDICQDCADEG